MFRKIGVFMLALILFSGCAHAAGYDGRAEDEELKAYIRELCESYGVPETLVFAVIEKESSWNADAVNYNETCFGLMQISTINFEWLEDELGLDDPREPYQNVQAGIYMLSGYLEKYLDYHMALMCYNCGENGARQLWQDGFFTNTYSSWVINRMHELEWEALNAARERLELQDAAQNGEAETPEEKPAEQISNAPEDTVYADLFPAPDGIPEDVSETESPDALEDTDRGLVFYAEDTVSKSSGRAGVRQCSPCVAQYRNLLRNFCRACIGQKMFLNYSKWYTQAGMFSCGHCAVLRWYPLYCTQNGSLLCCRAFMKNVR